MDQTIIMSILGDRPIAYHPILAKAFGNVKAAVFLSQLLYWQGKGKHGDWTYKTAEEFYEETGLSRTEQQSARKLLKRKKVLEEKLSGVPATLHFKVDVEKLVEVIRLYNQNGAPPSLQESAKPDCKKVPNQFAGKCQTSLQESAKLDCKKVPNQFVRKCQTIPETTTETTLETTAEITGQPAQSAENKSLPEPEKSSLLPDNEASRKAFGRLQANAKANGRRGPSGFRTLEGKRKFDEAAAKLKISGTETVPEADASPSPGTETVPGASTETVPAKPAASTETVPGEPSASTETVLTKESKKEIKSERKGNKVVSAQSAENKSSPKPEKSSLLPDNEASRKTFGRLQVNAKANGRRGPSGFRTLECKQKFDEAAAKLSEQEFERALTKALEQGITSVVGVTNYVAAWANNDEQRKQTGASHGSPRKPAGKDDPNDRVATLEQAAPIVATVEAGEARRKNRRRQTNGVQEREASGVDPAGADPFAGGPVDAFCEMVDIPPLRLPPDERRSWARKLRQIAERWSTDKRPITARDMERAIEQVPENERIGWKTYTSPYTGNFEVDIGVVLLDDPDAPRIIKIGW